MSPASSTKCTFRRARKLSKGDLLYTIDPREYQADLDSAAAALQQAQAQMAQAKSDYARSKQLSTQKVIAAQETEKQGTAVLAAEAAVRAAQARLDKAKLDLEWTRDSRADLREDQPHQRDGGQSCS